MSGKRFVDWQPWKWSVCNLKRKTTTHPFTLWFTLPIADRAVVLDKCKKMLHVAGFVHTGPVPLTKAIASHYSSLALLFWKSCSSVSMRTLLLLGAQLWEWALCKTEVGLCSLKMKQDASSKNTEQWKTWSIGWIVMAQSPVLCRCHLANWCLWKVLCDQVNSSPVTLSHRRSGSVKEGDPSAMGWGMEGGASLKSHNECVGARCARDRSWTQTWVPAQHTAFIVVHSLKKKNQRQLSGWFSCHKMMFQRTLQAS